MSIDFDPGYPVGHEPITDTQKMQVGELLSGCIRNGVVFDRLNSRDRNFWTFGFEEPGDLLDDEGAVPEYMIISPEGETSSSRTFRLLVKKTGLATDLPKTEIYKVDIFKNTTLAREVAKAVIKPDHIQATTEDSGVGDEELAHAAAIAATGQGTEAAETAYTEVLEAEIHAQWALGECSSAEATHFTELLQGANPTAMSLVDVLLRRY